MVGVNKATATAANNKAKNGWSFNPIIPPTTITMPTNKIKIGSVMWVFIF